MRVSPQCISKCHFFNVLQFRLNTNFTVYSVPLNNTPYTCNMSTSEHESNMNTLSSKYFFISENRKRIYR